MDIKKFADGYGAKMDELYELEEKQNKFIKEARQIVHDEFDKYFEELKEQVKLMTRDDMQEYLDEAVKRDHDDHMKALVLCAFVDTHEGRDKFVAENTLELLNAKMMIEDRRSAVNLIHDLI